MDVGHEAALRVAEAELRAAARAYARERVAAAGEENELHAAGAARPVKLSKEASAAMAEVIVSFAREAVHRPLKEAAFDGEGQATQDHVERCLPQLLLDFA